MENNGKNRPLFFLNDRLEFPPVSYANSEGLLAVGGARGHEVVAHLEAPSECLVVRWAAL